MFKVLVLLIEGLKRIFVAAIRNLLNRNCFKLQNPLILLLSSKNPARKYNFYKKKNCTIITESIKFCLSSMLYAWKVCFLDDKYKTLQKERKKFWPKITVKKILNSNDQKNSNFYRGVFNNFFPYLILNRWLQEL